MSHLFHDGDAVAAYVSGTMPPETLDAFEEHLLTCAECRAEVRLAAVTRVAMAGGPADVAGPVRAERAASPAAAPRESVAHTAAPVRVRRRHWITAGAVAAAMLLVVLVSRREGDRDPLGHVVPPAFTADAFRAAGDSVAGVVDSGMSRYSASDFAGAATLLARAARSDSSAGVAFYLGVSLLMTNDNAEALAALERAQRPTENPYAGEARYFAAKALVRLDKADSAAALLRAAPADDPFAPLLRAFADSLRRP